MSRPSPINFQGFANFALDLAQAVIDVSRQHIQGSVFAMNKSAAQNVMPTPGGSDTEEQFIGRFMANKDMQSEFPKEEQRAAVAYKQWRDAKNASAMNESSRDLQRIPSVIFEVPVVHEDVLTYGPGELGSNTPIGRDGAAVFYPAAAIKDKEYLETVKRSVVNVGTHEKNTGDHNLDPDGAIIDAWWDDAKKCAMCKGIAFGEQNVRYIEENKNTEGFGASAYIEFRQIRREDGIAPNGKPFTAIANKLINNHVAILANVRDRKNRIQALNALNEEAGSEKSDGGKMAEEKQPSVSETVKNELEKIEEEKARNAEYEGIKNGHKALNERLDKIEGMMAKMAHGKNKAHNGEEVEIEVEENEGAGSQEEGGESETGNAKNAMPAEETVKAFAEHLGMQFRKAPSFQELAGFIGVKTKDFSEAVTAVNAKRDEIRKAVMATNSQSAHKAGSFMDRISAI